MESYLNGDISTKWLKEKSFFSIELPTNSSPGSHKKY